MSPSRVLVLALVLAVSAAACAKGEAPPSPGAFAMPASTAAPVAELASPAAARALRITLDTSIEVRDLDGAASAVRAAVARHGGYLGEAQMHGSEEHRSAYFEAHVPVPALAAFRAEIGKLGEIAADAEKAEDVTEQRADIKARLGNARAAEKRLLGLLEQRAGSLADVVAVEKELSAARETIERMEAQERTLEGQIQNATVKIRLATRLDVAAQGPGRRIARAASDGVHNAGAFVVGVAVIGASTGPTLLLLLAFGYAVFRAVRFAARRAQGKQAKA
jgi:hypothetical protein